jgi:hypothetical protein
MTRVFHPLILPRLRHVRCAQCPINDSPTRVFPPLASGHLICAHCRFYLSARREADLVDSIGCLRYYAGLADKTHGQTIDNYGKDKFIYTIHQPIGVCGQM